MTDDARTDAAKPVRKSLPFDAPTLVAAFDALGAAALAHGTHLEIAVYGGSALVLAGNFRFATEDVDMAGIGQPWPQ